ncbi:iron chaperone [Nocardia sp. NPDC050175]|uniref:iron chaperone n=1 Tax=Nocardia sp. NPDC050175 TaxID=3364317 RepID=UPI003794AC78
MAEQPATIDTYIAAFPEDVRGILEEIRHTIQRALPDATEAISYDIPTFAVNGHNTVHFAGWKKHISLYPIPDGDKAFNRAVEPYRAGKGTLKFPLTKPIPYDLIAQVATTLATRLVAKP